VSRIIYGINPVREALKANPGDIERVILAEGKLDVTIKEIIKAARVNDIRIEKLSSKGLERIAGTNKHQGIAAFMDEFGYFNLEDIIVAGKCSQEKVLILILDGIQDPQNLGSLIRSANAAGVNGVVIPKKRAAAITPTVVKVSAGATELTPIARVTNIVNTIERLKENNIWVVGIEADSPQDIYCADLNRDLAIVIGSEGKGIRRLVKERCDICAFIPMAGGITSLNASIAGAVALFESLRQRKISSHLARKRPAG
jgi:23S rRNA (guanosine2251-2'-O)-methyltransferase